MALWFRVKNKSSELADNKSINFGKISEENAEKRYYENNKTLQIPGYIPNALDYGIKPSGVDQSSEIKRAHDAVFLTGNRFLYFSSGDYHASNLRECGNVIFVGEGVLRGAYRKQIFRHGLPSAPAPSRTIIPSIHLRQFGRAPCPVVVIMGDSTGGDSGAEVSGADVPSEGDFLLPILKREIQRQNPHREISFYSRCAGGAQWKDADDKPTTHFQAWYIDRDVAWLSYVEELEPDLLVFNFGMNDGGNGLDNFSVQSFKSVLKKVALFKKRPDLLFVTNRVPAAVTVANGCYSTPYEQDGRDMVAQYVRTYAIKNGHGYIDLNRRFNIVRDGFDICNTSSLTYRNLPWSNPFCWPEETRDFSVRAVCLTTPEKYWNAVDLLWLQIGSRPGNKAIIEKDQSGNIAVTIMADHGIYSVERRITEISCLKGTDNKRVFFSMFAKSERFCIHYNGSVVFDGPVERFGGLFTPRLEASGPGPIPGFVLPDVCVGVHAAYLPSATDTDQYGSLDYNDPYGGNGVNHPSSQAFSTVEVAVIEAQDFYAPSN